MRYALHMKRIPVVVLVLMIALLGWGTVQAVEPDEILPDPALEQRARDLSRNLRCLVCQNQSIDDSNAELARDLRLLVREQLVEGKSDAQILDYVVARYGDFILLTPPFNPYTILLWGFPFLVFVGALGWLVLRIRRSKTASTTALTPEEQQQLQHLLDRDHQ